MKTLRFAFFALLTATSVFAAPKKKPPSDLIYWKIESTEDTRKVVGSGPFHGIETILRWNMGEAKLLEWKKSPVDPNVGLLIYLAGASGTGRNLRVTERAVIVDLKTKQVIGDDAWRWGESIKGKVKFFPADQQPKWSWKAGVVEVEYPEYGDKNEYKF